MQTHRPELIEPASRHDEDRRRAALARQVPRERLPVRLLAGIRTLLGLGASGEAPTLTVEERRRLTMSRPAAALTPLS